MMEAARTSETVNFYQTTWCYNPEDSNFTFIIVYIITVYFVTSILILSSHSCIYIYGAETATIQTEEELGLAQTVRLSEDLDRFKD
jgi:hypothetical protein